MRRLLPGLAIAVLATAVAFAVSQAVPVISALLVAVLLGIALRNLGLIPAAAEPGLGFTGKTILRAGVVLLGFQLSLPVVLDLGLGAIAVILATVLITFTGTIAIGRAMRMPPVRRILVATGTSICGAAAVAAMTAVVDRPELRAAGGGPAAGPAPGAAPDEHLDIEESAATAVAGVTLFGTLALALLPVAARALDLSPLASGVWLGSGIHEVGQVVAAGGLMGEEVLAHAVVTKLGRVLTLAPMVLIVGMLLARGVAGVGAARSRRAEKAPVGEGSTGTGAHPGSPATESATESATASAGAPAKRPPLVPAFVAGFVVMVVLRSLLGLPDTHALPATIKVVSTLLLTAAMVAMGAGVRLRSLIATGGPVLALSAAASLLAGLVSLLGVLLLV